PRVAAPAARCAGGSADASALAQVVDALETTRAIAALQALKYAVVRATNQRRFAIGAVRASCAVLRRRIRRRAEQAALVQARFARCTIDVGATLVHALARATHERRRTIRVVHAGRPGFWPGVGHPAAKLEPI